MNNKFKYAAFFSVNVCLAFHHPMANATDISNHAPDWLRTSRAVHAAATTDRLIVKFKSESTLAAGASRAKAMSAAAGQPLRHLRHLDERTELMVLPAAVNHDEARNIAAQMQNNPDVEYAEPDYKMFPAATPSDPGFSPGIVYDQASGTRVSQWYLSDPVGGINAPAAWDITTGSASTVIAVVDTGILNHADLAGRIVTGYDFIGADPDGSFDTANDGNGRDGDATDPGNWILANEAGQGNFSACGPTASDWHGTHVAGVIAANANNSSIAGINWAAKIMSVRVLGKCGGYTSDIIDGMRWSVGMSIAGAPGNANHADIINLSLGISGTPTCSAAMQSAINDVLARGATVIVAAGNEAVDTVNSMPANCAGVISVGATLRGGQFATSYSNFGSHVTLSAPGGFITNPLAVDDFGQNGILSLNDRGKQNPNNDGATASLYGTSFSTAMVSGVVSLMLAVNPGLTPGQIKTILQNTATQQNVVDAAAAVSSASQGGPAPSPGGGGGGGCTIADGKHSDPTLPLLLAANIAWFIRRYRTRG